MHVRLRHLQGSDRQAWEALWRGYQHFYGVALDEAVTEETWRRLIDPAEPVAGLGAFVSPSAHLSSGMSSGLASGTPDAPGSLEAGQLVGIAHTVTHHSTWMVANTCYLQDLFVAPAARGRGIARGLIEAVYALADRSGAGQVYWLTHRDNAAARRLYDKVAVHAGFVAYERFAEGAPAPASDGPAETVKE